MRLDERGLAVSAFQPGKGDPASLTRVPLVTAVTAR